MTEIDDVHGDILPESVREQLKHVPLAAVRRAFQQHPRLECTHPADRLQPYNAGYDLCLDCGQLVKR